jgi:hypothetical protein
MECPTDFDNCPHARASATLAVKQVFAILGVDIDKPGEVEDFRINLRFGATMRRASDRGILVAVGVFVTALLALLGAGVVSYILHAGLGK